MNGQMTTIESKARLCSLVEEERDKKVIDEEDGSGFVLCFLFTLPHSVIQSKKKKEASSLQLYNGWLLPSCTTCILWGLACPFPLFPPHPWYCCLPVLPHIIYGSLLLLLPRLHTILRNNLAVEEYR